MATVNIRRDVTDPFYRYKMEKIQSKIEGKGNGIKTVIPNLASVAGSLARPPTYILKYWGFDLGAQTQISDDRHIINGAHEAGKLQDTLDKFIQQFVLCKKCKNPETVMEVKDGRILLDCKACGQRTDVDLRLKLSGFILKNQPKKGKKAKSTKKADRKARKEAEQNGEEQASQNGGSPHDSNSDRDENGDVELAAGSDDEFTRKIQNDAKELDDVEPKEIQWSVDTSEAAVKARAAELAGDQMAKLVLDDDADEEGGEENVYDSFGSWVLKQAEEKGSVSKVDDVEIYLKAKELGIQNKHKTVTVLAQTIFDENIIKQIDKRAPMLKKIVTSERHEKALLGGTERFVGTVKPQLIPQVSAILVKYYQNDLISEEVATQWGSKASAKFVDKATSKKVRKAAAQFIEWLETAESGSESEDEE